MTFAQWLMLQVARIQVTRATDPETRFSLGLRSFHFEYLGKSSSFGMQSRKFSENITISANGDDPSEICTVGDTSFAPPPVTIGAEGHCTR